MSTRTRRSYAVGAKQDGLTLVIALPDRYCYGDATLTVFGGLIEDK
jgi:hypothetical protein